MTLTLISPPTGRLISPAELGDHLRLPFGFGAEGDPDAGEGSRDDDALERAIDAATVAVERALSTALLRQVWRWRTAYRRTSRRDGDLVVLPLAPVLSVDAVEAVSEDGAVTALESSTWRFEDCDGRPSVRLLNGVSASGRIHLAIQFQAGYGDAPNDAPGDLKHAVLMLAGRYFEYRTGASEAQRFEHDDAVQQLLAPYRRLKL